MRPLMLTMTAFGPYSGKTVLDFEQLREQNIFVITGPTGAGKTTIFDGICYALYGETSGADRNTKGLRSDFIPEGANLVTEVEYTFMIKDKVYSISRCPEQMIPKKRGEGLTEMKHKVTLSCVDHDEFSPISNVGEVVNKVNELIGLDHEQFKKIVMIPQGEFRKFLQSNTDEKEKILRKIFGTQVFEQIQRRLTNDAKDLYIKIKDGQQRLLENLKMVDYTGHGQLGDLIQQEGNILEIHPLLQQAIDFDLEQAKGIGKEINEGQKTLNLLQEQLGGAKINNEKFAIHQQMKEQLANLLAQEQTVAAKVEQITQGKKAKEIEPLAQNCKDLEAQWKAGEQALQGLVQEQEQGVQQLERVQQKLNQLQEKDVELEGWQQRKLQLEQYREDAKSYNEKLEQCKQLEQLVNSLQQKYKATEQANQENKVSIEALNQQLERQREDQLNLILVEQQLSTKEQQCGQLRKLYSNGKELAKSLSYLATEGKEIIAIQQKVERLKEELKEKRMQHHANLGALLAKDLVDGEACPVCGSHSHPNPCQVTGLMVSQEEIELVEQQVNLEQEKLQQLLGRKEQEEGRMRAVFAIIGEELAVDLEQLTAASMEEKLGVILGQGKQASQEVEQLKANQKQLKQQADTINQVKVQVENLVTKGKGFEEECKLQLEQWNEQSQLWNSHKGALTSLGERIPEKYRITGVLEQEITTLEGQIEKMKDLRKQGEQEKEIATNQLKVLEGRIASGITHTEQYKQRFEQAKQLWQGEVLQQFGDVEQYKVAKAIIAQLEGLEQQVEVYNQQLQVAQARLQQAEENIQGLRVIDLTALEEQITKNKEVLDSLVANQGAIQHRANSNQKVMALVDQNMESVAQYNKQYHLFKKLDNLANGNNDGKLAFETYVLFSYFSDVLTQGNQRLYKMTNGRYYFVHRKNLDDRRKRTGLEIDVMDNYTGKTRNVSSLSGGESFKASLALALGLSDVVQMNAGGIELNTIFIDEGFGTLDSESLDVTIDCLLELQSNGRLVGVISHVEELKDRLNAWLVVEANDQGSDAYFKLK